MSFSLFIRAASAWTPHPRFFPDDAFYARLCLPDGWLLYWHDFGLYRILPVLPYALLNRLVIGAHLSPALLSLIALGLATIVFVCASINAGLSKRRGALLAGVLLSSPLLLETVNFWSGTLNYALVLLLLAAQLRASLWAEQRFAAGSPKKFIVTACGAIVSLLTYEIALPFVLAASALHARGTTAARRILIVALACLALAGVVGALAALGLYWPARFKLVMEQLTVAAASETTTTAGGFGHTPDAPVNAPGRAGMYGSLLFSFIRTGLLSPWFWLFGGVLAGLSFLPCPARRAKTSGKQGLPENIVALAFGFALVACVVYLVVTKSINARYVAFLLIYGAAMLAWIKSRVASFALASLLLLQVAVVASLPIHLRDVERAARGQVVALPAGSGDVVSVDGRLARVSWQKRFLAPETGDVLRQPLSPRACRYAVPCEECQ